MSQNKHTARWLCIIRMKTLQLAKFDRKQYYKKFNFIIAFGRNSNVSSEGKVNELFFVLSV